MNLSKIKKGTKIVFCAATINQISSALIFSITPMIDKQFFYKSKINKPKLERYNNLPLDFNTLDYLNISNSIITEELSLKNELSKDEDLPKNDCKEVNNDTFETYQYLILLNNRPDLRNKIRIAAGLLGDLNANDAHVLIEFKHSKGFESYDTVAYTPPLSLNQVKNYSLESKHKKNRKLKITLSRSITGSDFYYPTLDSLLYPGGGLKAIYDSFSYILKQQ